MKAVSESLGVARSQLTARFKQRTQEARPRRRQALNDDVLVEQIKLTVSTLPSYGYRRVWALLRRQREQQALPPINVKRVYRVMRDHSLLLERRRKQPGVARRHEGRVAVEASNTRWCSDGFEFRCEDGDKLRVTFALDCCDRELMRYVATTGGITGEMVQDLLLESLEYRFGQSERVPHPLEWLTDNGSCYIAKETRAFASSLGFVVCTTPVRSPQSNGMAEAFVKTFKRDYVYLNDLPDAATVMARLPEWVEDYNRSHPHKGLKMKSPWEYRAELASNE